MSINEAENLIGFQDSSSIVTPIHGSETFAMIDVGQSQPKKVEVPAENTLTLHLVMIAYLNSPRYKGLSETTRGNNATTILRFFSYLKQFENDQAVPLDCLHGFLQHLKKKSKGKDSLLFYSLSRIKTCLLWVGNEQTTLREDAKLLCRQYLFHAPKLKASEATPVSPLSKLFADCPYTDTQLLSSLIKLSIWIIHYEADLRSQVLQTEGMIAIVEETKSKDIYAPPISYASFVLGNASRKEARELYASLIRAVRASDNLVLKERLVLDIRHPFGEGALTEERLDWVLDQCIMKPNQGIPLVCKENYATNHNGKSQRYRIGSFTSLILRNFFVPSDVEMFAMQCLLASEKINSLSIGKLQLEDFIEIPQGVQFQQQKMRRPKRNQANITALHTKGSALGRTYLSYMQAKKNARTYFNDSDKEKVVSFQYINVMHGAIGSKRCSQAISNYFQLILKENSHLRQQLLKGIGSEANELGPIFWLLSEIMHQNKKTADQGGKYDIAHKKNRSVKRNQFVTEKSIGLSPDFIRQSAIISEDSRLINDLKAFNDPNVISQLSNHSLRVHNEVYIDRSTAKEKIESDRLFASRIGALMERDAGKMGELIENASVLNYDDALETLGLPRTDESAADRIAKEIDRLGIDIDLMDSFQSNGKKIFIANKTTTALIVKYLEHIRANYDDLLNDDTSQFTKAILAAKDYFYFSSILQKFPTSIRLEGEQYARSLSFDYAKLGDLVGVASDKN